MKSSSSSFFGMLRGILARNSHVNHCSCFGSVSASMPSYGSDMRVDMIVAKNLNHGSCDT